MTKPLILASASAARQALLKSAAIPFETAPHSLDEGVIKKRLAGQSGNVIAGALADAKALDVSQKHPGRLVLGADQVLEFETEIFDKPATLTQARQQLERLRGGRHVLFSALALARDGMIVWRTVREASLRMRPFSDTALGHYLAAMGEDVLTSVGGYKIEGPAIQLFESIEGEHSTILGLPLLPLCEALRAQGMLVP